MGSFHPYHRGLIEEVPEADLLEALRASKAATLDLLKTIPPALLDHRYAEGKWTIRQLLDHILDSERVFTYRALRFSRFDATELPGFDENDYAAHALFPEKTLKAYEEEFEAVRAGTLLLFQNMTPEMLDFEGRANGMPLTPRAIGFIMVGHNNHHCRMLRERYLVEDKAAAEA